MSKYRFQCAGTFSGVTSFTDDDDEDVNMIKVDFFGGKVNIMVSPADAERLQSRKVGSDVRLVGDVLVAGGSFKPLMQRMTFDGDKDFDPVTMEEAYQGLVFSGPAIVDSKRFFSRKDGTSAFQVTFRLFGATLRDFPVSEEAFAQIQEGQVLISAQIVSEVMKNYKGDLISKNWIKLLNARPLEVRKK